MYCIVKIIQAPITMYHSGYNWAHDCILLYLLNAALRYSHGYSFLERHLLLAVWTNIYLLTFERLLIFLAACARLCTILVILATLERHGVLESVLGDLVEAGTVAAALRVEAEPGTLAEGSSQELRKRQIESLVFAPFQQILPDLISVTCADLHLFQILGKMKCRSC